MRTLVKSILAGSAAAVAISAVGTANASYKCNTSLWQRLLSACYGNTECATTRYLQSGGGAANAYNCRLDDFERMTGVDARREEGTVREQLGLDSKSTRPEIKERYTSAGITSHGEYEINSHYSNILTSGYYPGLDYQQYKKAVKWFSKNCADNPGSGWCELDVKYGTNGHWKKLTLSFDDGTPTTLAIDYIKKRFK